MSVSVIDGPRGRVRTAVKLATSPICPIPALVADQDGLVAVHAGASLMNTSCVVDKLALITFALLCVPWPLTVSDGVPVVVGNPHSRGISGPLSTMLALEFPSVALSGASESSPRAPDDSRDKE